MIRKWVSAISHTAGRTLAVRLMYGLVFLATAVAFAQSYRGLYDWALHHGHIPQPFAAAWPIMVDVFLAVGELRLFVAMVDGDGWRIKIWAWLLTVAGLIASVAGNVGHTGWSASVAVKATNAVPPIAAAAALGVGLGLVKKSKIAARKDAEPDVTAGGSPAVRDSHNVVELDSRSRRTRVDGAPHRKRADPVILEKAKAGIRESLAAGEQLTDRRAAERWGITRYRAEQLIKIVKSEREAAVR